MRARWVLFLFFLLACLYGLAVPHSDNWRGGQLNAAVIVAEDAGDPDDTDGVTGSRSGGASSDPVQNLQPGTRGGKDGRFLYSAAGQNRRTSFQDQKLNANRTFQLRTGTLVMTWLKYYLLTLRR